MHHPTWMATVALSLALATPSGWAFDAAAYQSGLNHLVAAGAGDDNAIPKALAAFEHLVQAEPAEPLLRVNLGAATALQARTSWLPWKKMRYAEDGMALQDQALAQLDANAETRLQGRTPVALLVKFSAASTFLAVPAMFNRAAQGEKLLREVLASPRFEAADLGFKGAVWLRAAQRAHAVQHADEARRYLGLVIAQKAPQAAQAQALQGSWR